MPTTRFIKADIKRFFGEGETNQVVITDPTELERLLSFLPRVGERKFSPKAAGWKIKLSVFLTRENGQTVVVKTNFKSWTEGKGDWPLKPEFKTYIEDIFKKVQDQKQSGIPGT